MIGERKTEARGMGEKKREAGMTSASKLDSQSHPIILVVGVGQVTGGHRYHWRGLESGGVEELYISIGNVY